MESRSRPCKLREVPHLGREPMRLRAGHDFAVLAEFNSFRNLNNTVICAANQKDNALKPKWFLGAVSNSI
jgi:hypothetical protein